jgi:hypothetical protein
MINASSERLCLDDYFIVCADLAGVSNDMPSLSLKVVPFTAGIICDVDDGPDTVFILELGSDWHEKLLGLFLLTYIM